LEMKTVAFIVVIIALANAAQVKSSF